MPLQTQASRANFNLLQPSCNRAAIGKSNPASKHNEFITSMSQRIEETSTHSIRLGERLISYALRPSRGRSIRLSIDHRGLRVGVPKHAPFRAVEASMLQHREWIIAKLDAWHTQARAECLSIVDGVRLPLLGGELTVRLHLPTPEDSGGQRPGQALWQTDEVSELGDAPTANNQPSLTLYLATQSDAGRLLEQSLRARAYAIFATRLKHYAAQFGLSTLPRLSLSSARTRWGSCSLKSGIRLNWRLIHFPYAALDYVVVHELAHLKEMNHSPRFWALVAQHYPAYQAARQLLKQHALACPSWQ
ncbi:MAG: SprT family zinc-dependent metalloprotease [Pseudomonadota bacterium]